MKRKTRQIDDRVSDDDATNMTKEGEDDNSSLSDDVSEASAELEVSEGEDDSAPYQEDTATNHSEDSDSAPEDVSFKQSKQEAMDSVSVALKQIQENKKRLKEKRRKHHEMLAEQKQKKLDRLKSKKLPEEFLKEVSKTSDPTPPAMDKIPEPNTTVHHHFKDDQDDSGVDESTPIADRFYVVPAPRAEKRPHLVPSKALEFLQESLYGRVVKRSSVTNIMDHSVKRGGLPARHFTNTKGRRRRRKHGRRAVPGT